MTTPPPPTLEQTSVLFVLIGWAEKYDGLEKIIGGHRYLKQHSAENGEVRAFARDRAGYYICGIGSGEIYEDPLDVVFVARHPHTAEYEIIGIYKNAKVLGDREWKIARTKRITFFPAQNRQSLSWPVGQGVRRWAHRASQLSRAVHSDLFSHYEDLLRGRRSSTGDRGLEDEEMSAFEGKEKILFLKHRQREAVLRDAKIRSVLRKNKGQLRCEVPSCGFDFKRVYGDVGAGFAIVHHLTPLAVASVNGTRTTLKDLAIVCANCHAMIHRGGACRPLETLIPRVDE